MKRLGLLLIFLPWLTHAQNVVINQARTHIEISNEKSMSISEYENLWIMDEKGYDQAVQYIADSKFSKVSKFRVTVYDERGKKIKKLGNDDTRSYTFNGKAEVDDTKILILDPDYQKYPFRVEVESEVKYNHGFIAFPTWAPRSKFRTEVKNASLTIKYPIDYKLNKLGENISEPAITSDGKTQTLTWTLTNLASIDNDISYKQFWYEQPKVWLTPVAYTLDGYNGNFDTWAGFGDWFYELNSTPQELTAETRTFLNKLEGDTATMIKSIYNYMQKRTRYVSIQLGIGGYQSLPALFVDEKGYGDCKALTNYMKVMLDYKEIPSNFVLVRAGRNEFDIQTNFVSNQFNHVFLGIPHGYDTTYLECTNQLLPSGFLSTFTDDRDVLWIEKGSSQIIHSPIYDESINTLKSQCKLDLDQYGNATLTISRENSGIFYDDIMFYKSFTTEQQEEFIYDQFDFKDFIVEDFSYGERTDDQPAFASKIKIVTNNLARSTSDRLLVPVNVFPDIDKYLVHSNYKKYAQIKRAFALEDRVIMKVPEQYNIGRIPEIDEINTSFGSYSCAIKDLENGSVEIRRKVVFKKGEYKEDEFENFNDFMNSIKKSDNAKLILNAGT